MCYRSNLHGGCYDWFTNFTICPIRYRERKASAVLTAEDWETLVEWLETVEDIQVSQQAYEVSKLPVEIASKLDGWNGIRSDKARN